MAHLHLLNRHRVRLLEALRNQFNLLVLHQPPLPACPLNQARLNHQQLLRQLLVAPRIKIQQTLAVFLNHQHRLLRVVLDLNLQQQNLPQLLQLRQSQLVLLQQPNPPQKLRQVPVLLNLLK